MKVDVAYDHRFGLIQMHVEDTIRIGFKELLTKLNIDPQDALAMLSDKYQWTEGGDDIESARKRIIAETDVVGKVVLDIGGYDGWAAKQCLGQGAARAICLDNHQYDHYGWEDKKLGGVEYITGDLMYYHFNSNGNDGSKAFPALPYPDIIIFYNVLYHLKNPWAALDRLREMIKPDGQMLLCTLFRYHTGSWMYVYNPRECNPNDDTVYFGPSLEALERLLLHTGWTATKYALSYDRVLYRCTPTPDWSRTHEDS